MVNMMSWRVVRRLMVLGAIVALPVTAFAQDATLTGTVTDSTGGVQETITVTGEAPLVDTTKSSMGGTVNPRQMENIPLNGRNWMDLTLMAPGSNMNAIGDNPTTGYGAGVGNFQINIDGQQVTQTMFNTFGQA